MILFQPKKKTKEQADDDGEEDLDKLLASFDKVDNVCNYRGENMKKCKTKIAASFGLGVQCDHCRLRFCMNHGLPEGIIHTLRNHFYDEGVRKWQFMSTYYKEGRGFKMFENVVT